ncbi:MAG TPA: hypothetical protein VEF76_09210 [Patescibacteria group bacterium]|nr:hypothetical protein [Patescibacteria group bacterium]
MANSADEHPKYQCVSFHVEDVPDYVDRNNPGTGAIPLAVELFQIQPQDFNQKHTGRYYGRGKYGYVFEVEVVWDVAQNISVRNHPAVLNVFE